LRKKGTSTGVNEDSFCFETTDRKTNAVKAVISVDELHAGKIRTEYSLRTAKKQELAA
jgi:hypothetical protein